MRAYCCNISGLIFLFFFFAQSNKRSYFIYFSPRHLIKFPCELAGKPAGGKARKEEKISRWEQLLSLQGSDVNLRLCQMTFPGILLQPLTCGTY